MSSMEKREVACPQCAAMNLEWDTMCWLCGHALNPGEAPILAVAVTAPQSATVNTQFGLSTLLLVVTVVCICLGLVAIAPGLIVPLVAIVVPALVRTAVATRRYGGSVSLGEKVGNFAASLGLVILIWVAGLIALVAACTVIVVGAATANFNQDIQGLLILLSIAAILGALAMMGWLYYMTWPSKRK